MGRRISRRSFLKGLAGGAVGGLAVAALGEQGAERLVVERRRLALPNWEADPLKIAVLADLHVIDQARSWRAREAVRLAAAEKPDVMVFVGDFTSRSSPSDSILLAESLENVPDHVPSFGVLGNHDYAAGDLERILRTIEATPIRLLRNEVALIGDVAIAGVDDMLFGRGSWAFLADYQGPPSVVALLHEPDFVVDAPTNVSLQISGHTHGGQMCLPLGIPVRLPYGGRHYSSGFYAQAPRPLYVTRGVGTTGIDYRLWCPPEVSILEVVSA